MAGLNASLDRFVGDALRHDIELALINHAAAPHAFDILDDSGPTRAVIRNIGFFASPARSRVTSCLRSAIQLCKVWPFCPCRSAMKTSIWPEHLNSGRMTVIQPLYLRANPRTLDRARQRDASRPRRGRRGVPEKYGEEAQRRDAKRICRRATGEILGLAPSVARMGTSIRVVREASRASWG